MKKKGLTPAERAEDARFEQIEREEMDAVTNYETRAKRLAAFKAATDGKVWRKQRNGEWWLVRVLDGTKRSAAA